MVTAGSAPAASLLPGECGRRRRGDSPPSEGEHFGVNADAASGCRLEESSLLIAVPVRAAPCGLVLPGLMPF